MKQIPEQGTRFVKHRGDTFTVELMLDGAAVGAAYVRTNLGRACIARQDTIAHTEKQAPILARDWHDVPMRSLGDGRYVLRIPLLETGLFKAKPFFLPEEGEPVWLKGENIHIKVEAARTCCANTIYTAFPRQFRTTQSTIPELGAEVATLDREGYTVIPPSGTFRDLIRRLDFILGKMRFRILQLLPVHPVPTTFARMGRYGSPFAATDFLDVDPGLAEFDKSATPMKQFQELIDAVHSREARVFLDLPANHTGWASALQEQHPEWFSHNTDGTFASPGAWGTVWEDLVELDYGQPALHLYMAEVFRHWCRLGIDGFRCDAGYMVPAKAWTYIVAKVREEFPNTVFLLEGLGGDPKLTDTLLGESGLDWAYSELFQEYTVDQIRSYLPNALRLSREQGTLVNFAETHDNDRLAAQGETYSRMRTALCALLAPSGAFGITNGVEWLATRKIDIHDATPINWGVPRNITNHIRRLNAILEVHPAFFAGATFEVLPPVGDETLAVKRVGVDGECVLVLINTNTERARSAVWATAIHATEDDGRFHDLLNDEMVEPALGKEQYVLDLPPGAVRCLCPDDTFMDKVALATVSLTQLPKRARRQRLRVTALDIWETKHGLGDLGALDIDELAERLRQNPRALCRDVHDMPGRCPLTVWTLGHDERRVAMVSPGHLLLLESEHAFLAEFSSEGNVLGRHYSLPQADGRFFAVFKPFSTPERSQDILLRLTVFEGEGARRVEARVRLLADADQACVEGRIAGAQMRKRNTYALAVNELGGMTQARSAWSRIHSQYDALLAANLNSSFPVDRTVLFTRCRVWVICRDYSTKLDADCQTAFVRLERGMRWEFVVPVGMGRVIGLDIELKMASEGNAVRLIFERKCPDEVGQGRALDKDEAVRIVIRPDLEHRSCHHITNAHSERSRHFEHSVRIDGTRLEFHPDGDASLVLEASDGQFVAEPEWSLDVRHPFEQTRGLNGASDLFSPAYLQASMICGETLRLDASIGDLPKFPKRSTDVPTSPEAAMRMAMGDFIVKRDDSLTVIAGYPWFLDWGRDTLICLRGMIAAGYIEQSREIIRQFARFESAGTIPNMIRGEDNSNRETSDAPLWLFVAVSDLIHADGTQDCLDMDCGGRTLKAVLLSIADGYLGGTPNGIRVDMRSALVYSPAHFTWMDTNHPAGTPRQGYPVEIQALWWSALRLLAEIDDAPRWRELADRVAASVAALYPLNTGAGLSDCLHADNDSVSAADAAADDACRPNQLLAITLGLPLAPEVRNGILEACQSLLVPGAIRSLADRSVQFPQPVVRDGVPLNDPHFPYTGAYKGDEDTSRKPAYHNGTAWTWLFPSYCEALHLCHGAQAGRTAKAILASGVDLMNSGCQGHVPEIIDGNAPHSQRGCGAQAWGVTELYRVWTFLT
ncbi:MAG: glycogen debranching enzyme N-terminal domain-containing protein [Lentisphaeria bacterium]|nr:glycogen debranching enzyme N-terminal domain-containing protein [Lentisphaeria bacterium]